MTATERVAAQFEELLEVTDVGDALAAIGRPYDTVMKYLRRVGRLDLAAMLSDWKDADARRLNQALGRGGVR
ncbi:hypothetical protein SEA_PHINKY_16 [Microbacterium phage Phinky]|nr:hypothetical protein SEA_PHINKY_16 [Microbacterium phage Phinky]